MPALRDSQIHKDRRPLDSRQKVWALSLSLILCCPSTSVPAIRPTRLFACSVYVLGLKNVIRYLFGDRSFAKFAGTRLQGMIDSPIFRGVDDAHGQALTTLMQEEPPQHHVADEAAAATETSLEGACALPDSPPALHAYMPDEEDDRALLDDADGVASASDQESEPGVGADSDPSDEIHTGEGDRLCLLFALFVDGVQLHQHGRATTTVISLKCLDLPGFLANTKLASFNIAFISGPKEPTNLSEVLDIILQQFKEHEPVGGTVDGKPCVHGSGIRVWDPFRQRVREVFPVFMFAIADTPARKCWLLTTSHNSRSGCDKCGIRSGRELPGGYITGYQAFAGYGEKTTAVDYDADKQVMFPCLMRVIKSCLTPSSVCLVLQEWVPIEVRLCHDGKLDDHNLRRIMITDEMHDIRSQQAEAASAKFALQHPLPAMAAGGGRSGSNPQSDEELKLSQGPNGLCSICECSCAWMLLIKPLRPCRM